MHALCLHFPPKILTSTNATAFSCTTLSPPWIFNCTALQKRSKTTYTILLAFSLQFEVKCEISGEMTLMNMRSLQQMNARVVNGQSSCCFAGKSVTHSAFWKFVVKWPYFMSEMSEYLENGCVRDVKGTIKTKRNQISKVDVNTAICTSIILYITLRWEFFLYFWKYSHVW